MRSTWSPFQSPEVRDICAHLTAAEKQQLIAQARDYGQEAGRRFSGPAMLFGALIIMTFLYAGPVAFPVAFLLLAAFISCIWTADRQRRRERQQQVREFLAATEYGRARGYRPETLRMFAFPWSR
jgi:hypothetical protein